MATFSNMISVLFLVLFVTFAQCTHTPAVAEQQRQLSDSISHFSQNFYKATADLNPGKSLIMSPLSAQIALGLLSLGAEKDTLAELSKALYLPSKDFTRAAFKPAISNLNAAKGVTLKIANKVYVKEGKQFALSAQFKKDAVDVFESEVENVDFTKSVNTSHTINSWVEKKTNGRIKDLISPGSLNGATTLVLVNAVYFKGTWAFKFQEAATKKEDFFTTPTKKIQVDMMHNSNEYRYHEFSDWNASVLELPYEKDEMSMLIILPFKMDGLAALEKMLAAKDADIQGHVAKLEKVKVDVTLPKFKIETTIDLKGVFTKIGITNIFNDGAHLSGLLNNNESLVVSSAVQKAFIEVNEQGSEAAAATGMVLLSRFGYTPSLVADHPFYFALLHKGDVIFAGRFVGDAGK